MTQSEIVGLSHSYVGICGCVRLCAMRSTFWVIIPGLFASPGSQSRKQKHLQECVRVHVCVFVNLCLCVKVCLQGNTEVAVVLVPAVRMLAVPTALFHLPPLCVSV